MDIIESLQLEFQDPDPLPMFYEKLRSTFEGRFTASTFEVHHDNEELIISVITGEDNAHYIHKWDDNENNFRFEFKDLENPADIIIVNLEEG